MKSHTGAQVFFFNNKSLGSPNEIQLWPLQNSFLIKCDCSDLVAYCNSFSGERNQSDEREEPTAALLDQLIASIDSLDETGIPNWQFVTIHQDKLCSVKIELSFNGLYWIFDILTLLNQFYHSFPAKESQSEQDQAEESGFSSMDSSDKAGIPGSQIGTIFYVCSYF